MSSELEKAKEVILKHIDELLTVKTTKWVLNEAEDGYIEVDAGYTKEELQIKSRLQYRSLKHYYKLRDLLEEWI